MIEKKSILVTGSEGLIGESLCKRLLKEGYAVRKYDIANSVNEDIRDITMLARKADGCDGIVNLAAVSRVIWGEQNPDLCWETNADAVKNIVRIQQQSSKQPWIVNASSREVYGEQDSLPVSDDCKLAPMNVYGRAKATGERHISNAIADGAVAAILRFSNVYGSIHDHFDRVVPAFARAAAFGDGIEVHGSENTFDFTHLSDTVDGIFRTIKYLETTKIALPPMHLLTGSPTTLGELAHIANASSSYELKIENCPSRTFDVSKFYGDWSRAHELLGWSPHVSIESGFKSLVDDYRSSSNFIEQESVRLNTIPAD